MIHVTRHDTPRAFLDAARPLLDPSEAQYALIIGICTGLSTQRTPPERPVYLATLEGPRALEAAAVMTVPHNLVVTHASDAALQALANDLERTGLHVPGVHGPTAAAKAFAVGYCTTRSLRAELTLRLQIHQLTAVITPMPIAPGRLRPAVAADLDELATWLEASWAETGLDPHGQTGTGVIRRHFVDGRMFVWDDGQPVSMAFATGPTPNGIRIGGVYTPPSWRQRGYATACVATVSRQLLAAGRRFCFLFTDPRNPTSHAIYRRIGYTAVADVDEYRFDPTI